MSSFSAVYDANFPKKQEEEGITTLFCTVFSFDILLSSYLSLMGGFLKERLSSMVIFNLL